LSQKHSQHDENIFLSFLIWL